MRGAAGNPARRAVAGGLVIVNVRLFGGVGPEQVVEGVPAGAVLGEQMPAGQLGQPLAGLVRRDPGEAGRRADGDVRAGVQAQQPE